MKLQAKSRLVATETSDDRKSKEVKEKLEKVGDDIDKVKKGLPSKNNRMAVSPANQITKRRQALNLEQKKQDLKEQELRLKKD